MDEREARIARNEALFRTVNEQIEALGQGLASLAPRPMTIVCECGELACAQQIRVSVDQYERIRSDGTLFFVVPGHEIPDVETPVELHEEFVVVRKHEGDESNLARALDPRSSA
jgi:hypothetical protein